MISHIYLSLETTLLLCIAALYIIHCPFNKVEESFNTQAIHDIVNLFPKSLPYSNGRLSNQDIAIRDQLPWDHTLFPGVVPRTFVGALVIGIPLKLAKYFMSNQDNSDEQTKSTNYNDDEHDLTMQFVLQIGSRFALSSLVVLSISAITRAIHKKYGLGFRLLFLIATIGQFHYLFYAGRFIPNTYATILANLVFASWINRQYSKSIIYIAICVVVFRFDTAIFFGWLLFDAVFIRRLFSLGKLLKVGIPAGLLAMFLSFLIDSFFWGRPLIPELESLYFNVWLNKSHEWGIEPYFWYTYNCLPKILLVNAPFILLSDNVITRIYFMPTLAFILTYSLLPHKELRFILFITPLLNICVASGMMNVHYYLNKVCNYILKSRSISKKEQDKKGNLERRSNIATFLFCLLIVGVLTANLLTCFILSRISSHNYPGGQAGLSLGMTKELLDKAQPSLQKNKSFESDTLEDPRSDVAVYVNNLAAQTGLSRFVQVNGVYYSKTPHLNTDSLKKSYSLIYLILEPDEVVDYLKNYCPKENNPDKTFIGKWKKSDTEIKCKLPNQANMHYCSIIDNVNIFKAINMRRLFDINSLERATSSFNNDDFIRTRLALHIIRCFKSSKSNPFS